MIFIVYPFLIKRFAKVQFKSFFKAIAPAQLLAFSTSSSAATLPLTMERVEEKLGVSKKVSSFVLPLGATINMDGTSLYQAVAAVFIAQSFNIDLNCNGPISNFSNCYSCFNRFSSCSWRWLSNVNHSFRFISRNPIEGIGLVFAVDRILDMCRTTVNVTGDASVAAIVAYSENEIHDDK